MKNLNEIRLENLYILMALGKEGTITELAKTSAISRATLSPIMNGKTMLPTQCRKLEVAFNKPFGWIDEDHESEMSAIYDPSVLRAAIECIYSAKKITNVYDQLSVKGKADLLDKLYSLFTDPVARKLSSKSLLTLLGVTHETETKKQSKNS